MPRGLRVQLTEVFKLAQGEFVASKMQQRVDEHGSMPIGQHEAIPVEPGRVGRVMLEVTSPQGDSHFGHPHRGTRMTRFCTLYGIHGQRPYGVGHLWLRARL